MDRRQLLLLLLGAPLACRSRAPDPTLDPTPDPTPDPNPDPNPDPLAVDPLARALRALATQALPDGRFPSATYGFLREGHSITALLALASTTLPGPPAFPQSLSWLEARLAEGPLGFAGPAADYPVYATSIGLLALLRAGRGGGCEAAVRWLLDQQLGQAPDAGWAGAPEEGGFGLGRPPGQAPPVPPHPGHIDLSMTRRALQALRLAQQRGLGGERVELALRAGLGFVRRCRAGDGGFVYSPGELALNKSALVPGREVATRPLDHRGYGSATADALLALQAAGAGPEDEDIAAARAWLLAHHRADLNPGLEDAPVPAYARAMRFYYRAAAAEALAGRAEPAGWQAALRAAILAEQGEDGLWRNELALQKEDDPLIATGLALLALGFAA